MDIGMGSTDRILMMVLYGAKSDNQQNSHAASQHTKFGKYNLIRIATLCVKCVCV